MNPPALSKRHRHVQPARIYAPGLHRCIRGLLGSGSGWSRKMRPDTDRRSTAGRPSKQPKGWQPMLPDEP